jgi:hypothetical protein
MVRTVVGGFALWSDSGFEEVAERGPPSGSIAEKVPSEAKAPPDSIALMYGLKPVPFA